MNEFGAIVQRLNQPDTYPAVLATLVHVNGSSYRRAGARLLIDRHGRRLGSISGGCLEADLAARAETLLTSGGATEVVRYDTTGENDLVWGVGLGCQGIVHILLEVLAHPPSWLPAVQDQLLRRQPCEVWVRFGAPPFGTTSPGTDDVEADPSEVFVQRVLPPLHLVVCGAGDDARPVVQLAKTVGWSVTVVDPRGAFATAERFPEADQVRCLPAEDTAAALSWDPWTAAVIMTHHYRFDRPLLAHLLPRQLRYLGLLGPRRRAEQLLHEIAAESGGLPQEAASRLHAPVGLDLGGDGPTAVALAIVAEIQASVARRDARPLRERQGAIHE